VVDAPMSVSQQQDLVAFALSIQREINVRNGAFNPATERERKWAKAGACEVFELNVFQEALGFRAAVA
jgi:hypothetical protein